MRSRFWKNVWRSFPARILVLQLREKQMLLLFWLLLFAVLSKKLLAYFGGHYLFLSPEYFGKVSWWGFFIVGLCFGVFFIAWQVSAYNLYSYRFPFLAALKRPLLVFVVNNSIIPLMFLIYLCVLIVHFQINYDLQSLAESLWFAIGFLLGFLLVSSVLLIIFMRVNRNMISYLRKNPHLSVFDKKKFEKRRLITRRNRWDQYFIDLKDISVSNYIGLNGKLKPVRNVYHYNNRLLNAVFRQHHLTFSFFVAALIGVVILMGFSLDNPVFILPAAGSSLLILAVLLSIIAAIFFWLNKWAWLVILLVFLGLNSISERSSFESFSEAYGLDYSGPATAYNDAALQEIYTKYYHEDKANMEALLTNWKNKQEKQKPKLVLVSSSGGGLRSSVFTSQILYQLDSVLNGELMDQTAIMTGASAGQIGNAYYRELAARDKLQPADTAVQYLSRMDNDILNNVLFSLAVNDLFYPLQKFNYSGKQYKKDRSYAWEKKFNENTHHFLDNSIASYKTAEFNADVPLIIFTPYIINDGRQLIISSQGLSFLMQPEGNGNSNDIKIDGVEFNHFFKNREAENLRLSSALRMNATFPYFMNSTYLPTTPATHVYDAGYRDNYGTFTIYKFVTAMKDWINQNTSGIVLIQIESSSAPVYADEEVSILEGLLNPVTMGISTTQNIQEYNQDYWLADMQAISQVDVQQFKFSYESLDLENETAISWHLTRQEKHRILKRAKSKENVKKMRAIETLLIE